MIKVSEPSLNDKVRENVLACLDEGWISSTGRFIGQFEENFANYCGAVSAVATNNGTTALHLALLALELGPGDEVIVPNLTYVATANAVRYCGATPVFVDSQDSSFNMDPLKIEEAITSKTVGIIPVHLYGHPCDMDSIMRIARKSGLWVVEDAAEAHGAKIGDKIVGTFGDAAIFSFFGNKIITTGEGGCVTTNDRGLDARMRFLRNQGMDPMRRYWFPEIGYNYRMTNIQAAIGSAQLEELPNLLNERQRLANRYFELLRNREELKLPTVPSGIFHSMWMFTPRVLGATFQERDLIIEIMARNGVETRPVFHVMTSLPPYEHLKAYTPTALRLSMEGLNLPTHLNLSENDLEYVSEVFLAAIDEARGEL